MEGKIKQNKQESYIEYCRRLGITNKDVILKAHKFDKAAK